MAALWPTESYNTYLERSKLAVHAVFEPTGQFTSTLWGLYKSAGLITERAFIALTQKFVGKLFHQSKAKEMTYSTISSFLQCNML